MSALYPGATRWYIVENRFKNRSGRELTNTDEGANWLFDINNNLTVWNDIFDASGAVVAKPDTDTLNDWARLWVLHDPPYPELKNRNDYFDDLNQLQATNQGVYDSYKLRHEDFIFKTDVAFRAEEDRDVAESFEFSIWKEGAAPAGAEPISGRSAPTEEEATEHRVQQREKWANDMLSRTPKNRDY